MKTQTILAIEFSVVFTCIGYLFYLGSRRRMAKLTARDEARNIDREWEMINSGR